MKISDGYLTISLDSSELQYMFSIYGDLEVGDDVVLGMQPQWQLLYSSWMLLNTKGDIMKKKKKWIKLVIILLVIAIAAGAIFVWKSHKAKAAAAAATAENTATVEKRSISSQLSSSGTLEAKDTYSITSMVEGEVVSANFEEGGDVRPGNRDGKDRRRQARGLALWRQPREGHGRPLCRHGQ